MLTIREKDKKKFLSRYVSIFSSMFFNEKNWLAPKEKEFFVELIIANNKGVKVEDLPKYFNDNTSFKGKAYYVYLPKIQKKGWVKGNSIHANFDFSDRSIPDDIRMNFRLCGTES